MSGLVWAMPLGAAVAAPALTSLNYAVTDIAGGDSFIVATGTGLGSLTSVEFSRDSGTTWVAGTLGTLTSTTAQIIPPAMAASVNGRVRVTGPGGTSGTLTLEFWSPVQITGIDGAFDSSKGVATSGSNVTSVTEQSRSAAYAAAGAQVPTLQANVFGTKPAFRFPAQSGGVSSTRRTLASGTSCFWVGKWTVAGTSPVGYAGNNPNTIVGDNTGGVQNLAGLSSGGVEFSQYTNTGVAGGAGFVHTQKGSGLNDGNTRLVGVTIDTSGNVKGYSGATQAGTTGVVTDPSLIAGNGWNAVGFGYLSGDGFVGDLGAVIVVNGVISAGDLTKLYTWARARFGSA